MLRSNAAVDSAAPRERTRQAVGSAVLVGRAAEVCTVETALAAGRAVLLLGDAGVGKTALLDAVAASRRGRVDRITASTASGVLPLGAFLPLGADEWRERTITGVAAALRHLLLGRPPELLVVDDAHHLDPASAGLVFELARSGLPVVIAARTGLALPLALDALIRDRRAEQVRVDGLPRSEVEPLLANTLRGPVSATLATAMFARCDGHPLHLREVARSLAESGAIAVSGGRWRLTGPMPQLRRVHDLLVTRVESLPAEVRKVLEVVSVADGLDLDTLLELHGEDAVAAAEERGVLRVVGDVAMPGHPLYRDAALQLLPAVRSRRILLTLIESMSADAGRGEQNLARLTAWRLAAGLTPPVDDLLASAERVFNSDTALCVAFTDAAAERYEPASALRLAWLLINQRRLQEADRVLEPVIGHLETSDRAQVAAMRAFGAAMMTDRPLDALDIIAGAVQDGGWTPMLRMQQATALWRACRPGAEVVAQAVVLDPAAPAEARAGAAQTLMGVRLVQVARAPFETAITTTGEILRGAPALLTEGRVTLSITSHGRPASGENDSQYGQEHLPDAILRALSAGSEPEAATYGWMLGWTRTLEGRATEGADLIAENIAHSGPYASIHAGYSHSRLARARALAGDAAGARTAVDGARLGPQLRVFDSDIAVAEIAVRVAESDPTARAFAERAIEICMEVGAELPAVDAAFSATLLGHPAGPAALRTLLRSPQTPLQQHLLRIADAVPAADHAALLHAAAGMRGLGLRWFAIEVLHLAARIPGASRGHSTRLDTALTDLVGEGEVLHTLTPPVLRPGAGVLTRREAEIAGLVAAGCSDREVAARLGISVRTAESHLSRVFVKTGLHARDQVAEAFR